ncbi:hypothetical protein [Streptomyces yanii]|uniref:Uncharacterized protein n=1 Tax=Streptomyces yanii TaxID=78510 RepID=A0ABV5RLA1_9ACTN
MESPARWRRSARKAAEALAARMCTGPWQQALGLFVSPPRRSAT